MSPPGIELIVSEDSGYSANDESPIDGKNAARFVELLTAHQRQMYAYISTLLLGDSAASDVLQDTNVDLWKRASNFDFEKPFLPWAFAFARQQVMAHRKRQSRSRLLFSDAALARIEEECAILSGEAETRMNALRNCMKELKPKQSRLIRERYSGQTSVRMIAARLGDTAQNISSQLYRIRQQLGRCIEHRLAQESQA